MTNILILSAGTRNKVVGYFKNALCCTGSVVVTDASEYAPALYDGDKYYVVPRITEPGYIQRILEICRAEKISGVLSLIDPELSLLAKNAELFAAVGAQVIGSSYELCELSLDKYKMYGWLTAHAFNTARSYIDFDKFLSDERAGKISYPVFIKPHDGSASMAISVARDENSARFLFGYKAGMMVQQYMHGTEIGADVYIDMVSGRVVSIFTKKKLVMRAGETDKAVSFVDERLNDLICSFVTEAGYRGQIDIDIFDVDGEYYISEVNPRFGGGYPFAHECGCDHTRLIVNNLCGRANAPDIGNYPTGVCMMKYSVIRRKP